MTSQNLSYKELSKILDVICRDAKDLSLEELELAIQSLDAFLDGTNFNRDIFDKEFVKIRNEFQRRTLEFRK